MTPISEQELVVGIIDEKNKREADERKQEKRLEKQHHRLVEDQLKHARALLWIVWQMITGHSGGKVTPEGTERLWWLFQSVRRAEEIRVKLVELKVHEPYGSLALLSGVDVSVIPALERELKDLEREINEFLKKHRLAPSAEFSYRVSANPDVKTESWEGLGAEYILAIAVSRDGKPAEILRFRNCARAGCGQVFYAAPKAPHQKFCSSPCRQAFFDSSPQAKRKRKERAQLKCY